MTLYISCLPLPMNKNPSCPKCKCAEVVKNGKINEKQRFKCKKCSFQFTRLTPQGYADSEKAFAVVLYNFGLSMNAIGNLLLIIYFIFKHILLAQNRPESDADGSEVTESLSVIPFQVLSNWKIPDSSSLPFSDNSKLLHPDSNQENTREYVPARHDHLLLQAKTF